jgi:two-component system, OmpR family, phosphate regulon sensor histidine kinase PhoR
LALSRIEQEMQAQGPELQLSAVREVIAAAVETCSIKAGSKQLDIIIECPGDLTVFLEPALIEEGLINLIDNAIKYSPAGERIVVSASVDEGSDEVVFSVIDRGCGIAPEHHDRIFERFYRVDKARSRKLGGTGLGLSIVKHIALVHKGRVTVRSALGKGSTFSIIVPNHRTVETAAGDITAKV